MRQILEKVEAQVIFGCLGARMPEAYRCWGGGNQFYVLGPYHSDKTAGADYITKQGVEALLEFLARYQKLGNCDFESSLTSKRFGSPGAWLVRQPDVRIVRLDVTWGQCKQNLLKRRAAVNNTVPEKGHFDRDFKYFSTVMRRYEEGGCQVEMVKPNEAPKRILSWLN